MLLVRFNGRLQPGFGVTFSGPSQQGKGKGGEMWKCIGLAGLALYYSIPTYITPSHQSATAA